MLSVTYQNSLLKSRIIRYLANQNKRVSVKVSRPNRTHEKKGGGK